MGVFDRTVAQIYSNPCLSCYACRFKDDDPKCYKDSWKQCSVCSVIQTIIEKCQSEVHPRDTDKVESLTKESGDTHETQN